jgi:hypothetical protein
LKPFLIGKGLAPTPNSTQGFLNKEIGSEAASPLYFLIRKINNKFGKGACPHQNGDAPLWRGGPIFYFIYCCKIYFLFLKILDADIIAIR